MVQSRQELSFAAKASDDFVGIHSALDDLEGHLLPRILALCEEDRSHSTTPEFAQDLKLSNAFRYFDSGFCGGYYFSPQRKKITPHKNLRLRLTHRGQHRPHPQSP